MDLNSFKDVYGDKSSLQKLGQLLAEARNYGSDMMNYAEAMYGRRNVEEAKYWHNECMAMVNRIWWLYQEIMHDLQKKDETISKMYEILDDVCKDVREETGEDYVCGLCQYDGATMGESGDWMNECPGFEKNDCFCMKNEIRKMCGKDLLPEM